MQINTSSLSIYFFEGGGLGSGAVVGKVGGIGWCLVGLLEGSGQ